MASLKSSPCSSSSSVPTVRWTHEVFLSFRGEDTRNNFVDHLYAALNQRGIHVFKDDKALQKGKPISRELLKAIEESKFAVVVFSKNYAESSWCLDELLKIMECQHQIGQMVLPVFYHVDPSDVRGQKRDFDTAFQQHEDKFRGDMEKVNKWRKALATAAGLTGWHIKETGNGGEAGIIMEIAEKILNGIRRHYSYMEKKLIGMESRIEELYSLLGMEATEEVRMVGILGMGGIGKTSIAKALFGRIAHKFEGSSFVEDVRENSLNINNMCRLQEKILTDVLAISHRDRLLCPEEGASMIQRRFCKKKVLVVLDNVDDGVQLELLAATHEWFGPGSRIIISTRDEHLLSDADVIYRPDFLRMNEAVELFCWHAFWKSSPPQGYEELSERAIGYASCLPLALKVLGAFFRGEQVVSVWESALDRLAEAPDDKILGRLKLSFDGLHVLEKQIFLDIACFFKGKEVQHVTRVLDSFGYYPGKGIKALEEKCLITVSNNRLDMHDLVQEMGWQIVRDSFLDSRLWKLEQIHDFVKGNKKPKAIEAIMMTDNEYHVADYKAKLGLSADVFASMKKLRLLDIDWKFTCTQPTFLPDELRWLRWNEYPFLFLPLADRCKLVGLEMASGVNKHLWKGRKILLNLKFIHVECLFSLTSFPDVSGAPNIERLTLSRCVELVEVHESLGSHKRLIYLDMNRCSGLKRLPARLEMESLETLILSGCSSLERFPQVSPCMVKLSHINLLSCQGIKHLPSSITNLSVLSFLNLTDCWNLNNIPNKLGSMKMLQELWLGFTIYDYYGRERQSIGFRRLTSLSSLRKLDLSWRQIGEESFPKNIDAFSSLEELFLSGNSKLVQLPSFIGHLSHLKRLELNRCSRLEHFDMNQKIRGD